MRATMRLVLSALLLAPAPAFAAAVAAPVVGSVSAVPSGAGAAALSAASAVSAVPGVPGLAPALSPSASLSAPSLAAPSLSAAPSAAPALSAAPSLAAPSAAAALPALPVSAIPAASPVAAAVRALAAKIFPAANDNDKETPKSSAEKAAAPAKAGETAETASARGSRVFDQAAAHDDGEAEPVATNAATPSAKPKTPRKRSGPVNIPPSGVVGDDGGGPDYPHREVRYNGKVFPTVAFRPNTPVDELIVQAIDASKTSIKIALYEFSSRNILAALQRAKRRGVQVQVVLDYSNSFPQTEPGADYKRRRSEQIWALVRDKFDLRILRGVSEFGINHNKFAVFDGKLAEFGSYNWSYTSEHSHYENANFSIEKARVAGLSSYWDYLWQRAVPEAEAKAHAWDKTVAQPPADPSPSVQFNGVTLPLFVFTPGDKLEDTLVKAIDAAKSTIDYAMFSPRSTRVALALQRAVKRGVKVRAIIDESQSQSEYFKPYAEFIAWIGAETKTLSGPNGPESDFPMAEKMHNKFMILDGSLVETGSPNHTARASLDNYENAHFLQDAADVAGFKFHFDHMFSVAKAFARPAVEPQIPTDEALRNDVLHPTLPPPPPPKPDAHPLPPASTFDWRGHAFPSSAFRPYEPVAAHVVAAIDEAKKTLKISIYQFEQQAVLDALLRAKARGVKVQVVLDRSHVYTTGTSHEGGPRRPRPMVVALVKSGFDLMLLKGQGSGIMHNKFLLADDELLEGGSYNYTDQSETDHFENVYFTLEKERVALYGRYFQYMRDNAEEVDFDKLEEILTRTSAAGEEESAQPESSDPEASKRHPDPDGRTSKFPAPPKDEGAPIVFNGRHFPRAIFSPQGGIEDALIQAVEAAKATIDIAMFSFYSRRVAEALLAAKQRGVAVRLVLDKSQASLSSLDDWFAWHDFDMRVIVGPDDERDPLYQKMHNKFGVFDGKMVETGSFNYSPNAEKNSFENSNWFDVPEMAARYAAFFERMFADGTKPRKPKREPVWKDSDSAGAE